MNLQELERLLERFYLGQSSPGEEERLTDILCREDIPEKYLPDRDIFLVIRNGREIPEPSADLDNHLRERLDLAERNVINRNRSRRFYLAVTAVASLLIAFSSYLILRSYSKSSLTLAETEMVTQRAFNTINTVSVGLREGKSAMSGISHIAVTEKYLSAIPEAGSAARKSLSQLDYFNFSLNELIVEDNSETIEEKYPDFKEH